MSMAIDNLCRHYHAFQEAVGSLHMTVGDQPLPDHPMKQDIPALVDMVSSSVDDLSGWAMEAFASVQAAQQAINTGNLEAARRALAGSHAPLIYLTTCLMADLMLYERIADLARLRRTRGEWRSWSVGVKQGLDACRQLLFDLLQAQLECWQEIAEHGGRQSITVHATSVGAIAGYPDANSAPRIA